MAERRMFSKAVINCDKFLDMPLSARCLYFYFGLNADDEGFVGNPNSIKRFVGCSDDDFKLLVAKGFIIPFDTGVIVISHWKLNNYIPKDRFHNTIYRYEKSLLSCDGNNGNVYFLSDKNVLKNECNTTCIQPVYNSYTESSLGQSSLGQVSIGKDSIDKTNLSYPSIDDSNMEVVEELDSDIDSDIEKDIEMNKIEKDKINYFKQIIYEKLDCFNDTTLADKLKSLVNWVIRSKTIKIDSEVFFSSSILQRFNFMLSKSEQDISNKIDSIINFMNKNNVKRRNNYTIKSLMEFENGFY